MRGAIFLLLVLVPALAAAQTAEKTPQTIYLQNLPRRVTDPSASVSSPGPAEQGKVREGIPLQHDPSARRDSPDFDVQVERLWFEKDETMAEVRIWNTSSYEISEITLDCTAMDEHRREITHHQQKLLAAVIGTMGPGFTTTVKMSLERGAQNVRAVACTARGF